MNCFISILDFSRALRFSAARCKNREVLGFRKKFPHAKREITGVDEAKNKNSGLAATYFRTMLCTVLSWALRDFTSEFGMGSGGTLAV